MYIYTYIIYIFKVRRAVDYTGIDNIDEDFKIRYQIFLIQDSAMFLFNFRWFRFNERHIEIKWKEVND